MQQLLVCLSLQQTIFQEKNVEEAQVRSFTMLYQNLVLPYPMTAVFLAAVVPLSHCFFKSFLAISKCHRVDIVHDPFEVL